MTKLIRKVVKSICVIVPGGPNVKKLASTDSWTSRWRVRRKTLWCKKSRVNRYLSRFKMNWRHSWSTRPLSVRTQSFVHQPEWLIAGSGIIFDGGCRLMPNPGRNLCPLCMLFSSCSYRGVLENKFQILMFLRGTRIWRLGVQLFEYLNSWF